MQIFFLLLLLWSLSILPSHLNSNNFTLEQEKKDFLHQLKNKICLNFQIFVAMTCNDDTDCQSGQSCFDSLCVDVCDQGCGLNAVCITVDGVDDCECLTGYTGDPLFFCSPIIGLSFSSNLQSPILIQL